MPKWPIPSSIVSHLVKAGLPANITAIAERAEEVTTLSIFSNHLDSTTGPPLQNWHAPSMELFYLHMCAWSARS